MVVRNLVLAGTVNSSHADFVRAAEDLETATRLWPEVVPALITGRHPPEEFGQRALHRTGIKEVVEFASSSG